MTIVDKIAEAMYNATGEFGLSEDDAERAAQAAWDVVKAEMLGDDFRLAVADKYFENGFVQTTTEKFDYATEALTTAINQLTKEEK